ncbi:unnamed protein product [Lupinus luteus]|uniref:AAA+ ATPase domain-containing protein n=1 Tax=Lupinus luteus TaxID=3873 RepID=A0AAV1YMS4_LUPLU
MGSYFKRSSSSYGKMVKTSNDKKECVPGRGLVDIVLSWSIADILNQHLYQNQVDETNRVDPDTCDKCNSDTLSTFDNVVSSSYRDLNESQRDAVLSCISLVKCHHQNNVVLIWGPPGTGKTTTTSLMLYSLLKCKCRTLTCAPTNVAVVEVAKRLLKLVKEEALRKCYGLGDVVFFGNAGKMKVSDDHKELQDVFLDHRVRTLRKCMGGWTNNLKSMTSFLEDPRKFYEVYLKTYILGKEAEAIKRKAAAAIKRKQEKVVRSQNNLVLENESAKSLPPWTFEEFVSKRFRSMQEQLTSSLMNMSKHLPTSIISKKFVKNMFRACDLLNSLVAFLGVESDGINDVFDISKDNESGFGYYSKWRLEIKECLNVLKLLPESFSVLESGTLREFCLSNACLICERAVFGRSLFERLVKLGHRKHLLNVQHRMHPCISLFPNIEFYGSEIVNAKSVKDISYNRRFLRERMYDSYSFIDVPMGREEFGDKHSSRRNLVEALPLDIGKRNNFT